MPRALITGAAGFIGSHLTEACLARGWEVTAVDALTTHYSPAAKVANARHFSGHPACRYLEADLLELDLGTLIADVDVVVHLAAQAGVRGSWGQSFDTYVRLNVTVLQRLLEAAQRAEHLETFVFASSSSVYGHAESLPTSEQQIPRPISPYGATKALGEHLCHLYFHAYGVPVVSLRYFSVYGPRQRPDMGFHRMIEAALAERDFSVYGDGLQSRDFTYVADAVEATIQATERARPGEIYNIGGGSSVSMLDALEIVRGELGGPAVRFVDPNKGDARHTAADVTKARRELAFEPAWSVADGLAEQIEWHRAREETLGLAQRASVARSRA